MGEKWYTRRNNDKPQGPFSKLQIEEFAAMGKLLPTDFVITSLPGARWNSAINVPGLPFPPSTAKPIAGVVPSRPASERSLAFWTGAAILLTFAAGIVMGRFTLTPTLETRTEYVERPSTTIEFGGKVWTLVGPCDYGATFRPSMKPRFYTAGDPSERLHELIPTDQERVYARLLSVERMIGGRWLKDGPCEFHTLDGVRSVCANKMNDPHGVELVYYPSGKLKFERHWMDGEYHGINKGWYEDGRKMYESYYDNGVEISGKVFADDGISHETKSTTGI